MSTMSGSVTLQEMQLKLVLRQNIGTGIEDQPPNLGQPMQDLYVKVVRARNLAAKGAGGTNAPYVKVAVGEVSAKTQVIRNDFNPEWNRAFAFSKGKLHGKYLEISVWDADLVDSDDFLGALSFQLEDIPARKPRESPYAPIWYKLEERPGRTMVTGQLLVDVWMDNRANEAFQEAWQSDTGGNAHLRSKVYLSPTLWYLRVHVIQAEGLHTDEARTAEPFVELNLGRVQAKRIHASTAKGTDPVWNKDVILVTTQEKLHSLEELLTVTVKDKVTPNVEEIMGVTRIPLHTIARRLDSRQQLKSETFDLDSTPGRGDGPSKIHLKLCFEGGYHVFDEPLDFISSTRPTAKQLWKTSLGVVHLGVLGANNLLPMHRDASGRPNTDAYCVAKYGEKWIRTRTITENRNPRWKEQYSWDVYDPCTVLTVSVFDNRHVSNAAGVKDVPIGKVQIRLSLLPENNLTYTNSYPLLVVTASGVKKMGEVELSVCFACASTVKAMQAYIRPPLPAMHYLVPIDESDAEDLRIVAMNHIASRLARCEPPLRQEVVQFMLDEESKRWSMRRQKANFFRIANVLADLFYMAQMFHDICTWKDPKRTVLVHALFLTLWYSDLFFPTAILGMLVIGARNYMYRARLPSFVDGHLLQGGEEHISDLDELEEEFNVTSKDNIEAVLKLRYERLRAFAGKLQNFMGEVATHGERLQALWSWRDPRATSIFGTFCLIIAIVIYVTPFQVLVLIVGVYVMRHPKFRNPLPSAPLNLFRHLPGLSQR